MANSFDEILSDVKEANNESSTGKKKLRNNDSNRKTTNFLSKQQESSAAMLKRHSARILWHDPKRVRMWEDHNRFYSTLNEDNCRDLIDGFNRSSQGQEFPAIVRRVKDDERYDYEVICGARRHWVASYKEIDLLIEVRELSDRQAFTIQDTENRDRRDVSDLERAVDYKRAINKYFDGNVTHFAEHLNVDRSNLRKLLMLTDLDKRIIEAYTSLNDIKVHHGVVYKQMMEEKITAQALLDKADELAAEDLERDGPKVFALLKSATPKAPPVAKPSIGNVTVAKKSKNGFQLDLKVKNNMDDAEIKKLEEDCLEMIRKIIDDARETATG